MKRFAQGSNAVKKALVAGALVATILAVVGLTDAEGGTGPTAGGGVIGIYAGGQAPASVGSFGDAIGEQPAYAMDFFDGDSWSALLNTAPSFMAAWVGSGYSMIWGLPILPNDSAYSLADGAAGDYNSYFLTLAQEMVAGGQGASIVRPGWEFNGGWYPWAANGQAAAFIGYWQQIVDTMRSVPGQSFKFEWNPTAGDLGVGDLADYYPGNAYVDYIGLDVYDQNWATYPGGAAEFANLETEPYGLDWLASFAAAQGKPITLPEWGLGSGPPNDGSPLSDPGEEVGGGDNPTFINDMAAWIKANNVYEATYFDFDFSVMSPTVSPNSFSAFASDFGSGSSVSPTTTTTTSPPVATPATTAPPPAADTTSSPPTGTTTTAAPVGTTTRWTPATTSVPPTIAITSPSTAVTSTASSAGTTVTIEGHHAPVPTAKGVVFSARIRASTPKASRATGTARWRITSASGVRVPCRSDIDEVRNTVLARCAVAPRELYASEGPYTVSVSYAGRGELTPVSVSFTQYVVPAVSTTRLRVPTVVSAGRALSFTALVSGVPTVRADAAVGAVRFSVRGPSGRVLHCRGGDTASLSATGRATCTLAAPPQIGTLYVAAGYRGDSNFSASTSRTRSISVRQAT